MSESKSSFVKKVLVGAFCAVFMFAGMASALEISLEPANVQREVGGKVRVHIYANNAIDLISMGVKVSFNPAVLRVADAKKYEAFADGWVMDADAVEGTTDDRYTTPAVEIDDTNGKVTMIGGRLMGSSTVGLDGKVLLGWIVFEAIANGTSNLGVDLGKYHPNHPTDTFDNFVRLGETSGIVDEPTNVPGDLGVICVVAGACYADIDGDRDVDMVDSLKFKNASPSSFGATNYNPGADFDADGDVDMADSLKFRQGSPRSDCPSCP